MSHWSRWKNQNIKTELNIVIYLITAPMISKKMLTADIYITGKNMFIEDLTVSIKVLILKGSKQKLGMFQTYI